MLVKTVWIRFLALQLAILILTSTAVVGTVLWESNFTGGSLDGWQLNTYYTTNLTSEPFDSGPLMAVVENDALRMLTGANDTHSSLNLATHDSTVTEGTWSFDFKNRGLIGQGYVIINFMADITEIPDFAGQMPLTPTSWGGYSFLIIYETWGFDEFFETPGSILMRNNASSNSLFDQTILDQFSFYDMQEEYDYNLMGTSDHHIDITRTFDGEMKVYVNDDKFLSTTDNSVTSSGQFAMWNWWGDFQFDNFTVQDEIVDPNKDSDFGFNVFLVTLFSLMIVIRLVRRRKILLN
ncbi:MAG: hypothetical protein ACXAD7_17525 [Candidatus Kariarchaeaceae archaeon]|jgi:hypothetical protein